MSLALPFLFQPNAAADTLTAVQRLGAYVSLGATAIVTEEANPLLGGLAAYEGTLRLATVIMSLTIGTWVAHLLLYALGRSRGYWVRRRWPRARVFLLRSLKLVRRHPWRASLLVRFAWGLRLALPIACGAGRVPILVYSIGSAVSSLVWATLFTLIGWELGETALRVLGAVRRYDQVVAVVVIAVLVIGFFVLRRRAPTEKVTAVLAWHDPEAQKDTTTEL